jgi:predicted flap endonuclease-1-like 5' DNA nuclease
MSSTTTLPPSVDAREGSYVSWSAVFAGGAIAAAYSFVMLTFGAAIGLTLVSPFEQTGTTQIIMIIAAALWLIWVQVSGFALGAYIAGRVRARAYDASDHQAEMRDGIHGVLVWAAGVLIGVFLGMSAAGTMLGLTGQAATSIVSGAAQSEEGGTAVESLADTLLRPAAGSTQRADAATRAELGRIAAPAVVGGEITSDDRTYLAQVVASQSGLSVPEAEARVDQALATARTAAQNAKNAAVIMGFIVTASLLVSAAAAWWAATVGGTHRDSNTDLSRYVRFQPPLRSAVAPAGKRDDLTQIKGIGPALKNQLYGMNITSFRQIAAFNQDDVARVGEELNFPGRIEREKWVEQAQTLAARGART